MKKVILFLVFALFSVGFIQAQQDIFKKYGHKKEILTLSKGKYQEVFKNEEVVQIGTVLLNTKTNRIVELLQIDTTKINYIAELSSRFLTVDPLAVKHPEISPYAFCNNNPVRYIDPDGRDWYENKDGNATWRKSKDAEYKDNDGNTWKNIGTEYLLFDGSNLHYFQQKESKEGELSLSMNSYGAVSGRAQEDGSFSYSEENQAKKGEGPIPDGLYKINPQKTQKYDDLGVANKIVSTLGIGGSFKGGTYAWGEERAWIYPKAITVFNPVTGKPIIRNNFSIHGGNTPGSAGCIDLCKNAPAFFNKLSRSKSSFIRLKVLYGGQ